MKYGEKRFSIWRMELLHPAMWHVALESWQWIHQVAAPCSVIRDSGMTCRWIRPVAAPCNVTHSSGIMTLNLPGGSTLQCGRCLWDDMPQNSPKRPPYWNSTSDSDFDHITAVDMSLCTSLRNYIKIGPRSAEKNDVMSIFKMADLSHLGFWGSNNAFLVKSMYDFLWVVSRHHSSKLLSFWENRVLEFGDRQTNRQTNRQADEQIDTPVAWSRSRCRERRLNK